MHDHAARNLIGQLGSDERLSSYGLFTRWIRDINPKDVVDGLSLMLASVLSRP